jgi:hypothetical protein
VTIDEIDIFAIGIGLILGLIGAARIPRKWTREDNHPEQELEICE